MSRPDGDATTGISKTFINNIKMISRMNLLESTSGDSTKEDTVKRDLEIPKGLTEEDERCATYVQSAWRRRMAYLYAKELKQEKLCHERRQEMKSGLDVQCEACASAGKASADIESRNRKKAWRKTDELLFNGMSRMQMSDRGDNWNERWQEALALPRKTDMEIKYRRSSLTAVYSDFVHTAVTYGRTIISEYFLHEYMKSVRPKQLGGVAGGKKYLWRGILFKLADGSQGPYGGSDEAAAKAAGHELRGASEYLKTRSGLCVPPMCLLDYKGFRMLAQAHVPIGASSFKMGTRDGGRTVLNKCRRIDSAMREAAKYLGLRGHTVGGCLRWKATGTGNDEDGGRQKVNVGGKELYAAADVEGHEGEDSRMYLLDLARAFPPEDPNATPHLSGMLSVSAKVVVKRGGKKTATGTVMKAHPTLVDYDILYPNGEVEEGKPAHLLRDLRLFIFYRLLRPEFVRDRGRKVLAKVNLPPGHRFPNVVVTNPMMYAIASAKAAPSSLGGDDSSNPDSPTSIRRGRAGQGSAEERYVSGNGLNDRTGRHSANGSYSEFGGRYKRGEEDDADIGASQASSLSMDDQYVAGFNLDRNDSSGFTCTASGMTPEEWQRNAMECGIEFVETEDKYYEGFMVARTEEEEELETRGGIGYRPYDGEAPTDPFRDNQVSLGSGMYEGGAHGRVGVSSGNDSASGARVSVGSRGRVNVKNNGAPSSTPGCENVVRGGVSHRDRGGGPVGTYRGQPPAAPNRVSVSGGRAELFEREGLFRRESSHAYQSYDDGRQADSSGAVGTSSQGIWEGADVSTGSDTDNEDGGAQHRSCAISGGYAGRAEGRPGFRLEHMNGLRRDPGWHQDGLSDDDSSDYLGEDDTTNGYGGFDTATEASSTTSSRHPGPSFLSSRGGRDLVWGPRSTSGTATDKDAFLTTDIVTTNPPQRNNGPSATAAVPPRSRRPSSHDQQPEDHHLHGRYSETSRNTSPPEYNSIVPCPYDKFSERSLVSHASSAGSSDWNRQDTRSANPDGESHVGGLGYGPIASVYSRYSPAVPGVPNGHVPETRFPSFSNAGTTDFREVSPSPHLRVAPRDDMESTQGVSGCDEYSPGMRTKQGSYASLGSNPSPGDPSVDSIDGPPVGDDDFIEDLGGGLPLPRCGVYNGMEEGSRRAAAVPHPNEGRPDGDCALGSNGVTSGNGTSIDSNERRSTTKVKQNRPVPLSPDALTAFSNGDPEAKERNREVTEATQFLLMVLVPATAHLLCSLPPADIAKVNLARELHKHGVNMRHIGLLRQYITPPAPQYQTARSRSGTATAQTKTRATDGNAGSTNGSKSIGRKSSADLGREGSHIGSASSGGSNGPSTDLGRKALLAAGAQAAAGGSNRSRRRSSRPSRANWFAGKSSQAILRDRALVEVVVRTLKLVLREFQRRWMKSAQSSSEQGMHMLVAQFLNLVSGYHQRSKIFWQEEVTVGVCQRFGTVALTASERADLWAACSERPELLRMIIGELVKVTGVRFKENVVHRLQDQSASVVNFEFNMTYMRDIEAVVTPLNIGG